MSTIHITRPHQLSAEAAREVAESLAAELAQEFGLQYAWDGEVLRFHTFGVRGDLQMGTCEMVLQAQLGAMLLPFQGKLESEIQRHFDKHLLAPDTESAQRVA